MSDTYEFLKAQKDAIIAKQDAELAEWLTAASEDISHYRRQLAEAKAKIESLQAAQTEAVKQTEGLANLYTSANNLLVFIGREGSVSTDSGPISALSDAMYELDGGTLLDDAYFQTKDQKGKAMIELPEPTEDDEDDYFEEPPCERCHGDGMDPWNDYLLPCPLCLGDRL